MLVSGKGCALQGSSAARCRMQDALQAHVGVGGGIAGKGVGSRGGMFQGWAGDQEMAMGRGRVGPGAVVTNNRDGSRTNQGEGGKGDVSCSASGVSGR